MCRNFRKDDPFTPSKKFLGPRCERQFVTRTCGSGGGHGRRESIIITHSLNTLVFIIISIMRRGQPIAVDAPAIQSYYAPPRCRSPLALGRQPHSVHATNLLGGGSRFARPIAEPSRCPCALREKTSATRERRGFDFPRLSRNTRHSQRTH